MARRSSAEAVRRLLRPPDAALRWRGDPLPGARRTLRVAHFGDCGWRAMPHAHGIHNGPGYPLALQERLNAAGVALEFSSSVVTRFEDLPVEDPAHHIKLTGPPDVVLVHLGAMYQRRILLPDTHRVLVTREAAGRLLGAGVHLVARLQRPFVRRFGRPASPYRGTARLEEFLAALDRLWPAAHVVLLLPYGWCHPTRAQRAVRQRVAADLLAAAGTYGCSVLDVDDLVPVSAPGLRCANGYNLGRLGSAAVGDRLADWCWDELGLEDPPDPAPERRSREWPVRRLRARRVASARRPDAGGAQASRRPRRPPARRG